MADLVLSVWSAKPPHWSAIVAERAGFGSIADEGGATMDEARDAALAQLTPEQLADLRDSMISDLAAVARHIGHNVRNEWYDSIWHLPVGSAYRQLLGLAITFDALRRDQEAESRDTEREGE